ncbi:MAG TPA: formate dehydrogenase subunit gamma [Steroidobacteraceae bacterium]|jgi:formate dehydrogenase subunit gamma|nr:formate dehydrogenase subunit gamma [Steroidobacteraceae bacterium]
MAERNHPALILRHPTRDRVLHWLLVIAFLFVAASGLALFHPSLFWLTNLTGGGPWTTILHPFIGLVMVVTFIWFAAPKWRVNQLTASDYAWLKGFRYVLSGEEEKLPEVGEYNAGQKVLYFTLMACVLLLAVTGFVIWRRYFAGNFSVRVVRLGALVHAFVAFVLLVSIVVHISAAVWEKGSITSMVRGTVTPGWAYKHRRAWFRDMIRPGAGH